MNICARENELFAEWRKAIEPDPFCKDGVVDEPEYRASKRKVVFVLKNVSFTPDEDDDIRNHLKDYQAGGHGIWKKVAKIAHGIRKVDLPNTVPVEYQEEDVDFFQAMLATICVLNLNKRGGKSVTPAGVLARYAMKDAAFIRRQFALYDPDLTLCCGYDGDDNMLDLFREVMEHKEPPKQFTARDEWGWYERAPGKLVLNIYHPSARGRVNQSPEEVLALIDEISGR